MAPSLLPGELYYASPNSIQPLPADSRFGPLLIAIFGTLSTVSTATLLVFISYRIFWNRQIDTGVTYSQNVVLIFNLLLADFFQGLAFSLSFHWVSVDGILAPTTICDVQASFITFGDMSSGAFILFIGIHTMISVVYGKTISYRKFICCIIGCWIFSIIMASLGPIMHPHDFYSAAGQWCWINSDYELERLLLHYLWIFIFEFGSLVIYSVIFYRLRTQLSTIRRQFGSVGGPRVKADLRRSMQPRPSMFRNASVASDNPWQARCNRATFYMVVYPAVYCFCTLPIAIARMYATGTGNKAPTGFYIMAGSALASCGWIDAFLYTLTRRVFVKSQARQDRSTDSPARSPSNCDVESLGFGCNRTEIKPTGHNLSLSKPGPIVIAKSMRTPESDDSNSWLDDVATPHTIGSFTVGDVAHYAGCHSYGDSAGELPLNGVIQTETKVEVTVSDKRTAQPLGPSPDAHTHAHTNPHAHTRH